MAKEKEIEIMDENAKLDMDKETMEENVETIKLSKKIKAGGTETDEIKMDFSKITGNMMVNAEKMARSEPRMRGDDPIWHAGNRYWRG